MRQIERVRRARSQLVISHPFYGCLALNMRLVADDPRVPTMAVDGKHLYVNEEFAATLSDDELRGVLVHEVMHMAYGHPFRRGHRKHKLFNVAGDYAINRDIMADGFTLPRSRLYDAMYDGLPAEAIYARLYEERAKAAKKEREERERQRQEQEAAGGGQPDDGEDGEDSEGSTPSKRSKGSETDDAEPVEGEGEKGDEEGELEDEEEQSSSSRAQPDEEDEDDDDDAGQGSAPEDDDLDDLDDLFDDEGGCGGFMDAAAEGDPIQNEELEAEWKAKVFQAAAIAKAAGNLPAGAKRLIEEYRKPTKADWRTLLRSFVQASSSKDYTWSRPNRRYVANGLYLPGMESDAASLMLVGIDTSGSVNEQVLAVFADELQSLLDSGATDRVQVVFCDTKIHGEPVEFFRGDKVVLEPKGGGGTDFAPVTAWAAEQAHEAACLIHLTDLFCRSYGEDPGIPTLWAAYGDATTNPIYAGFANVPFGEVVHIDPHA